jgi:MFS family permease
LTAARARRSVAAVFFVHAAISGTLAPRIPAIKADLGLGSGGLGAALTAFAAALFIGTRVAALLVERFGSRRVVRVGLPLFAVSLVGPALAGNLAALTGALVPFGIAAGLLDVAMNAQAVEVERRLGRPIMAGLHGFWSVGVLTAAGVASGVAGAGIGVEPHLVAASCLFVALSLIAPVWLLPGPAASPSRERGARRLRPAAPVLALGAVAFCSFLGEGAAADWSGVYVREDVGSGQGLAAFAFTAFAIGMVASRFSADRLSARAGPVALVRAGGLLAACGLGVGLLIHDTPASLVGFALLGLGLAPIVPIAFSAAGNLGNGARALGWVVTMGYVGSVLGPAVIGLVAHRVGLRTGLVIPAALAVLAALLAPSARTAAGGGAPTPEPPIV